MEIGGSGPPPIPTGTGRWHLEMTEPFRLVSLDAAAFDWLWRVVEQHHRRHQDRDRGDGDVHTLQAEVSGRAVIAFREAAGTLVTNDQPVTKRRRRLVKEVPNQ